MLQLLVVFFIIFKKKGLLSENSCRFIYIMNSLKIKIESTDNFILTLKKFVCNAQCDFAHSEPIYVSPTNLSFYPIKQSRWCTSDFFLNHFFCIYPLQNFVGAMYAKTFFRFSRSFIIIETENLIKSN